MNRTAGGAVVAAGCLAVIGGLVVLATSGGGGSSSGNSLAAKLQGQWQCRLTTGSSGTSGTSGTSMVPTADNTDRNLGLTIGNGVFTMSDAGSTSAQDAGQGTWKMAGTTLTLGLDGSAQKTTLTGIPNGFGPFHTVTSGGDPENGNVDITGTTSQSRITIAIAVTGAKDPSENGPVLNADCTRGSTPTLPESPGTASQKTQ